MVQIFEPELELLDREVEQVAAGPGLESRDQLGSGHHAKTVARALSPDRPAPTPVRPVID